MITKVFMPKLSDAMETGKVIKWLKKVGDAVKGGDVILEIETDKANVEIEAFGAGVLRKIVVEEGGTVPVGEMIGVIADPAEDISSLVATPAKPAAAAPTAKPAAAPAAAPAASSGPLPAMESYQSVPATTAVVLLAPAVAAAPGAGRHATAMKVVRDRPETNGRCASFPHGSSIEFSTEFPRPGKSGYQGESMKISKRAIGLACAASLALAACGSSSDTESSDTTNGTEATGTSEAGGTATSEAGGTSGEGLLDGEIKCENQFEGKTVTVFSPVRDSENDTPIADYVAGYDPLAECTGLKIEWQGTDQFETEINVRLEGGDAPDVIDFPQPGLMAAAARKGYLQELPDSVASHTKNDFFEGWLGYSSVDDKVYGIPGRSNIKSLVWYSPAAFKDKGYAIPTTLDELKTLSDKIAADGGTPWCVGAESGVATGWVLTDWMEDMMLRVNGEEVYDQWVSHEIPFNDAKVKAVADAVGAYVKNPTYLGGENNIKAIATTKFQDGGLPILSGKCFMHRQASFYSGLWPDGTKIGADGDIDFFYLPSNPGTKYMLGAGDIYAAGSDKPETYAVLAYTGSADYQLYMTNTRGELSPNKSVDLAKIEDPMVKRFAEMQADADVFRFDGSDLMPGAVGSGTLWTEITAWVTGGSTDDFVNNVESSWPSS